MNEIIKDDLFKQINYLEEKLDDEYKRNKKALAKLKETLRALS